MTNKNRQKKVRLFVPMDRPVAVFTLDTDLEAEQVLDVFDHLGWDTFTERYEYSIHNSFLIPDTENAYVQYNAFKASGESVD